MKKLSIVLIMAMLAFMFSACSGDVGQSSYIQMTTEETSQNSDSGFDETPRTNLKGSFEIQDENGNTYITVEDVYSVQPEFNGAEYVISIVFNDDGAEKFADVTTQLMGETLNIVVDGETVSSPVINGAITDGKAHITGDFTLDEIYEILDKIQE